MTTSELTTKYDKAFLKIQPDIDAAVKDGLNPHFKNTYTSLEAVIGYMKPILNDAGFIFRQTMSLINERQSVITRIIHVESGEWIQCESYCAMKDENDPQKHGSSITYLRRYQLKTICGMSEMDDDGNQGAGRKPKSPTRAKPEPKSSAEADFDDLKFRIEKISKIDQVEKAREHVANDMLLDPAEKKAAAMLIDMREKIILASENKL
jgi:hypothetical protein